MRQKAGRTLLPCAAILLAILALPAAETGEESKAVEEPSVSGEAAQAPGNPLQPFERLIGGRWEIEGSYQEFEWGVGGRSVVSRTYFVTGGRTKRVAEGLWYWHPGSREIRGLFTAVDMPVEIFEYTTRFEDGRMISQLHGYASGGEETEYTEIFDFKGADSYEWSLFPGASEGGERVMGGTFHRSR